MADPKFQVTSTSSDGRGILATADTYEEAKAFADGWLGWGCTWQGTERAVSRYGDVLNIEACNADEEDQEEFDEDEGEEFDEEWEAEMRMEQMMLHGPEAGDY